MNVRKKLYCFVDETGQDTQGKLFLVAIILTDIEALSTLESELLDIELLSGKKKLKWNKTKNDLKVEYLKQILTIKALKRSIYYSIYHDSLEYSKLTSLTIAKTILTKANSEYEVSIIIDGLNDKERIKVTTELKSLRIKYRKIRGMKDEQNVFLRLADSMAGFLRDVSENQSYANTLMKQFKSRNMIMET